MKTSLGPPLLLYMPRFGVAVEGAEACIRVRFAGEDKWVDFRGPPYHLWSDTPSPMSALHDALHGWHTTVLHQSDMNGDPAMLIIVPDRDPHYYDNLARLVRAATEGETGCRSTAPNDRAMCAP